MPADWTTHSPAIGVSRKQIVPVVGVDYADPDNLPVDPHSPDGSKFGPPRAVACNETGDLYVWAIADDPATDPSVKRHFIAGAEYALAVRQIDDHADNSASIVLQL